MQKMLKKRLGRAEIRESKSSIESHTVTTITNMNERTHLEDSDTDFLAKKGAQFLRAAELTPSNLTSALLKGSANLEADEPKEN